MSEQGLGDVLRRVSTDPDFVDRILRNSVWALSEFELSAVELFALTCADESALRRLLGTASDVPLTDLKIFRDAACPTVNRGARDIFTEFDASGKTSQVTSYSVTVCCWGDVVKEQ
jgi:hypothetical protein